MALFNIQKTGRVTGQFPEDDARIIDQFMDEVIEAITTLDPVIVTFMSSASAFSPASVLGPVAINRCISANLVISNPITVLQRHTVIKPGINVTIQAGGEMLIL